MEIMTMPKLGLTMTEGTVGKWLKNEGDTIKKGEMIAEVSTDKLTNEIESAFSGTILKFLIAEGDAVPCFEAIALIGNPDEDISSYALNTQSQKSDNQKVEDTAVTLVMSTEKTGVRINASPAAKKLANDKGLDISQIKGTGPEGRITLDDVNAFAEKGPSIKSSPMAKKIADEHNVDLNAIAKDGRIMKEDVIAHVEQRMKSEYMKPSERRIPLTQMRKVISERMTQSWHVSPAVTLDIKVDMTALNNIKNSLAEVIKVSYSDLFVKILSKVLLEFPLLNASLDGNEIILRNYTNIGVAVALEDGLIVPVIKYANVKGLKEISDEIKDLAKRARNNELKPDDYHGGTFTITNLGMYGITSFSPIINQPEVAILGINTIEQVASIQNGTLVNKPILRLSLTTDHRVVDGAVAAQFLSKLKTYIEKPELMLL
jgi:pyruvate dehydrogenase E2 component (dihydrolipoamide acetyltransferase)